MFAPKFTLPTRTPSRPAADKPTSSARPKTKPSAPAQPAQPKLSARQRRKGRLAAEQQTARRVPPPLPPPPTLASVLSNRMAWFLTTTRRLEASGTSGDAAPADTRLVPLASGRRVSGRLEASGTSGDAATCTAGGPPTSDPPRLLARSCAVSALVPPVLRQMLREKIGKHLARHFEAPQWEYPIWLSAETEPLWGAQARRVFAGRGLRKMSLADLHWLIIYEAERLARIVVERPAGRTLAERVAALRGTLRRIGQVFREVRWRCGEQRALWHVNLALSAIHWW